MRSVFLFSLVSLFLASCSEPDTICSCLETGKKLDKTAQEILTKGTSPEREKELIALKKERKQKCTEFDRMDNVAMRKRMQDCE